MSILMTYIIVYSFGVLLGNFATSIFYRLPRGLMIYGFNKKSTKPPCCSICHHDLKPYEYLPVISMFTTRFKCNYCGSSIPYIYVLIEQAGAFWALACFELFNHSPDLFLLIFCFGITCLLSTTIYLQHQKIYPVLTASLVLEGGLYHTLFDQTLMSVAARLGIGGVVCLWLLKDEAFFNEKRYWLVNVILPGFVWLDFSYLIYFIPLVMIVSSRVNWGKAHSFILNTIILFALVLCSSLF